MHIKNKILFVCCFILIAISYVKSEEKISIITPKREFRAAWVATVANIDWPTKPGLSTKIQKKRSYYYFG